MTSYRTAPSTKRVSRKIAIPALVAVFLASSVEGTLQVPASIVSCDLSKVDDMLVSGVNEVSTCEQALPNEGLLDDGYVMAANGPGSQLDAACNPPWGGSSSGFNQRTIKYPLGTKGTWAWKNGYGEVGWIYHEVRICESSHVDSEGYRYILWDIQQKLDTKSKWELDPLPATARYDAIPADATFLYSNWPNGRVGEDCETNEYSLGVSVGGSSATYAWSEDHCKKWVDIAEQTGASTGVKWETFSGDCEYRAAWCTEDNEFFHYVLITRTLAGKTAVLKIHHVEWFYWPEWNCYGFCGWASHQYAGDYELSIVTTASPKTFAMFLE